jgi:hypothetical protein
VLIPAASTLRGKNARCAKNGVQQEVMSPPESFSFLFLFPHVRLLASLGTPRPFLTKEKEERGKRKISGRVDIISCCTPKNGIPRPFRCPKPNHFGFPLFSMSEKHVFHTGAQRRKERQQKGILLK